MEAEKKLGRGEGAGAGMEGRKTLECSKARI